MARDALRSLIGSSPATTEPTGAAAGAPSRARRAANRPHPLLVWALIGFLFMEYVRPPALQALRLQFLFTLTLPVLWLVSKDRTWSRNLSLQACFLIMGALALPFAHNSYVVYLTTRYLYGFFVTALATTWLLGHLGEFRRVLWIWVGIMVFQATWAITHAGTGYGSYLNDENDLSLACDMAVPFALLGFQMLPGWKRWACGAALLLLVGAVVASFSRGGFLGLAAALGYCLIAGRHRMRNLVIACGTAGLLYLVAPSEYTTEMATIGETTSGTAETRLFLWTGATNMWLDHPILGVGPMNAKFLLGRYQPEPTEDGLFAGRQYTERIWGMKALHSVYFQLLAEWGIVGCVLFGWMTVRHFATLRRLRRVVRGRARNNSLVREAIFYSHALEASMAGFLVAGAFLSMLYYPFFWFLNALGVALDRAIRRELNHQSPPAPVAPAAYARS